MCWFCLQWRSESLCTESEHCWQGLRLEHDTHAVTYTSLYSSVIWQGQLGGYQLTIPKDRVRVTVTVGDMVRVSSAIQNGGPSKWRRPKSVRWHKGHPGPACNKSCYNSGNPGLILVHWNNCLVRNTKHSSSSLQTWTCKMDFTVSLKQLCLLFIVTEMIK